MGVFTNSPEGWGIGFQNVDMANAAHALVFEEAVGTAQTTPRSRNLLVDPNGGSNNLTLPAANTTDGGPFIIINTADAAENVVILDNVTTRGTLAQNEGGIVISDGARWYVTMVGTTT